MDMVDNTIIIYTDGASKGNPGPAGAGAVFTVGGKVQGSLLWFLPSATNNQAEYTAVLFALQLVRNLDFYEIEIRSDSMLIVKQLNSDWTIKNNILKAYFTAIQKIIMTLPNSRIRFVYIPREQNKEADALANKAIIDFKALDK